MSTLKINDVFMHTEQEEGDRKSYRVLWINRRADRLWIIHIPDFDGSNEYYPGPVPVPLSQYEQKLNSYHIVVSEYLSPPVLTWSDEKIRANFERKDGRCPPLDKREKKWEWLEEFVTTNAIVDILEGGLIPRWVHKMAYSQGVKRAKLYNALHCYWALGHKKNALMGSGWRGGAKGKARAPKARFKAEPPSNVYPLTEKDKEIIQHCWKYYRIRKSTSDAYYDMLGLFYSDREILYQGKKVPKIFPPGQRPSKYQFKTWGPNADPTLAGWRLHVSDKNFANNYKGMSGSAKDGITAVGQMCFCDTTTNDAILCSITSRLKVVGTVNRLMIIEGKSEIIAGFYVGFEPPSYKTFLMAVAHAAQPKVEFFRQYGIEITEDMGPGHSSRIYFGDNGEYRSEKSLSALQQFGSTVEFERSGSPASNSPVESNHHSLHARVDHKLPGTTFGKKRERGEKNPAFDACLSYYEYMHEFLKEVNYYNCEEIVELPMIEMRRDGVKPTRMSIYHWYVKNGYVIDLNPDVPVLRAHLYPALPAVLHANGVFLLRPDRGDKPELVHNLRLMSEYLVTSGLLDAVRKNGVKNVIVRGAPENPSDMWLETDEGLKKLTVLSEDPILSMEATVTDCMSMLDEDREQRQRSLEEDEQNKSNLFHSRKQGIAAAQDAKAAEMAELQKRPTKTEQLAGIDQNRKAEIAALSELGLTTDIGNAVNSTVEETVEETQLTQPSDAPIMSPTSSLSPGERAMRKYKQEKNNAKSS